MTDTAMLRPVHGKPRRGFSNPEKTGEFLNLEVFPHKCDKPYIYEMIHSDDERYGHFVPENETFRQITTGTVWQCHCGNKWKLVWRFFAGRKWVRVAP